MVVAVPDQNILEFTPLVPNLTFIGKSIIIPTRSSTMVECFAIDWLIVNLGLERVGIFTSPNLVSPMVQRNAYSDSPTAPLTTAVELFADASREQFVVQIRSEIFDGRKFSGQLSEFVKASEFANVLILTGSDSCFLSGAELEQPRISIVSEASNVVNGGLAKHLCELIEKKDILMATTRGRNVEEIATISREMALVCAKMAGISKGSEMNIVPPSIKTLV